MRKVFAFRAYYLLIWAGIVAYFSATGAVPGMLGFLVACVTVLLAAFGYVLLYIRQPQSTFRAPVAIPLALVLITSILLTQWPYRLHFFFVRPALESMITRLEKGEKVVTSVRVGLWTVRKAEPRTERRRVGLWLTVDTGADIVLTKGPANRYNVWSTIRLDQNWNAVWED